MTNPIPVAYNLKTLKNSLQLGRVIRPISTDLIVSMMVHAANEGLGTAAILLDWKGYLTIYGVARNKFVKYEPMNEEVKFAEIHSSLNGIDPVCGEYQNEGLVGSIFGIPIYSDYLPEKTPDCLTDSYLFTYAKPSTHYEKPLLEANVPPHAVDPLYDHTLDVKMGATTAGQVVIPITIMSDPRIPHFAQNLEQLQAELTYWTALEKATTSVEAGVVAYKNIKSCELWISRRQEEDQTKPLTYRGIYDGLA